MSIKVRAQIHPFTKEYADFYCDAAPLAELYKALNAPLDITHARFLINDEIVTDPSRIPQDGSTVYILLAAAGSSPEKTGKGGLLIGAFLIAGGILATVATFGAAGFIGSLLIGAGVSMMLGGIVLMNMEIPKGRETGSQMESIRGSKNQVRKLGYIPVLFGRHLVVPDVAAPPYTEIDANGQQWLTQLFCAGYNDMIVETDSLKVGDTALIELSETRNIDAVLAQNDARVKLEILQNGEASLLYPQICVEQQFNTVLKHADDDGQPIDITRTTADKTTRINVDIFFPQGLIKYDDKNNAQTAGVSVSLQYKAELDPDSAYADFPGWAQNISNQTVDMFRLQAAVTDLSPGRYTVRIIRITKDSSNSQILDTVYVGSIRGYADEPPVRDAAAKDITIIALKVRASALANGVIDNFNFIAQSNIPDYDPSAGSWTRRLTKNPASMLLYALQGKINPDPVDDSDIDWDSFREFWGFCNDKGYTCNAAQGDRELFSALCTKIAKTGRASVLRVNGAFSVVVDKERPAPVQLFSPRNTIAYTQTIVKADIPDEIAIEFIDETVGWTSNERSVYNTPDGLSDGTEKTKQASKIWGITDPDIVFKFARYQYACIKNRPIIHSLECDIEYLLCKKGDLIEYAGDTALTGIAYGKVTGLIYSGAFITGLLSDTAFPRETGQSYGIRCRKANGQLITLGITNQGAAGKSLLLADPQPEGTLEEGDQVIFGITGKITRQLIVSEITPADNFRASLKCVEYAPEIFNVDAPDYVVPPFDNKITTSGSITDSGVGLSEGTRFEIISGQIKNITDSVGLRPTYPEIVEGFSQAGATVIPARLSLSAAGGFRFVTLSWAKQTYLSNLKEYQVQVSENAADWYAPRFDGTDWKGAVGGVFSTASAMVVHPNIPPAGTDEHPVGRFLYYRVRQLTMLGEFSDWSDVIGAQTKLADSGDYGVNSISANALKANELLAWIAKLAGTLVVDPRYGLSSENAEWADGDTRAILNSRQIAFQYFVSQVWQTMARLGLEGVEVSQLFSRDKLYISNDDMLGRRMRGFDIGVPYLSDNSRVAHCDSHAEISKQENDTYLLDQNGANLFLITGNGSLEGEDEGVSLILKATAPYATEARALFGNFCLETGIGTPAVFTLDFWIKYFWNEGQVLLAVENNEESLRIEVVDDEPYLNDVPTDDVWLNDTPTDGAWLNEIKAAHTRIARYYQNNWQYVVIENEDGMPGFTVGKWYHIGIVNTGTQIRLLINAEIFAFDSQPPVSEIQINVNPTAGQVDGENSLMLIDEILLDTTAAETTALFLTNTSKRAPWGKLDDSAPWAIINVKDPACFRTNIFKSPDFAAAVMEILNTQGA
ncbi:MAG: hypothetical protein LBI67_05690 [Treponema sp.]|nr:hypothetical protein [Treponema sp.]